MGSLIRGHGSRGRLLASAAAALPMVLAIVLAIVLATTTAAANGRFPTASQLLTHPRDPTHMVLRTTYGLLLSKDSGTTWDWICERAVGYGGVEDPAIAIAGNGALLAGVFGGLSVSTNEGCSWTRSATVPQVVVDLASRPSAPDTVYAISGKYAGKGDGGSLFHSELHVTTDGGASWSQRASLDPTLLLESVEVAPSSLQRIYVTAVRDADRVRRAFLVVSDDDGKSWVERGVPLEASERAAFIAAVDPASPDRVYLRTSGPETNRLLVTDDAGRSLRTVFRGGALLGFALSEAGDKVYVGGTTDGLQVAAAPAYRFEKRWAKPVQCLALRGRTLWACSSPQSGFELGSSDDDGATFQPRLTLAGMRGPLACEGASSMNECPLEWDKLRADFGVVKGPAKQTADAGMADVRPTASRCGCSAPGAPAQEWGLAAALAACVGCLTRRRRH